MLITSRTAGGRCPVCGGEHAACGPPSASVPVDERMEVAAVSGPLKKYRVTSPSGVETVMKLNDADAKARDLTDDDLVQAPDAEATTLALPDEAEQDEPEAGEPAEAETKKASAPDKARTTASNKGRGTRGGG